MTRTSELSRLRNFGIIAHVDAGKTTLTERILYVTGRVHRAGGVDEGTTTTDFDPEERKRGITIGAAAVTCPWREHVLTLVDTPGHADFTIEVERSLRVLDGAVTVLDGVAGVEPQTEKVWRQADQHGVPRLVLVNKLDRAGADLDRSVAALRERLGASPVVISIPIVGAHEEEILGVVDLVGLRAFVREGDRTLEGPVPAHLADAVAHRRATLVEACAEHDEAVLDAWLAGDVSPDVLRAALRRCTIAQKLVPVLAGSAARGVGIEPLLDAIVELLPAPAEGAPFVDRAGGPDRERTLEAPLAALCFKVSFDTFGALAYVRVYAGVLRRGDVVRLGAGDRLRIGRLVRLFGGRREDVDEARAGEIVGILGAELATGETLSDPSAPILLEPVHVPEPVLQIALEPRARRDRDHLGEALRRLRVADPSLVLTSDPDTGQTLLAGMGELHLEIAVTRLASEHDVEVAVGAPRVSYRETITRVARVEHVHSKQTGGPGQYAHVILEVAPADPGAGLVFEDRVRGGAIPRAYIPGVQKGCELAMQSGVLGGHPMIDVRVALLDGSFHSNDSSELAFQIAGERAFRMACREAGPVLLEPWMRLEVRVPTESVGDVVGDLSARRGRVIELRHDPIGRAILAEVPLAELFRYATRLGSLTRGRGTHVMELARRVPVPDGLVERALARTA
jgi:elongation factor G